MHSSRMRTTRFSGHLYWGVSALDPSGHTHHLDTQTSPFHLTHPPFTSPPPTPCEQNDWQTGVKTLPCPKLRLGAVKNYTA